MLKPVPFGSIEVHVEDGEETIDGGRDLLEAVVRAVDVETGQRERTGTGARVLCGG